MDLQVRIYCPHCQESKLVMIVGGWDISKVVHDCKHGDKSKEFQITYEPERRVF